MASFRSVKLKLTSSASATSPFENSLSSCDSDDEATKKSSKANAPRCIATAALSKKDLENIDLIFYGSIVVSATGRVDALLFCLEQGLAK
jgi:hypothetical protein